jgi:signal transduction histidine kinase
MRSITRRMTVWYALAVTGAVVAALATGRWLLQREMVGSLGQLHEAEFREVVQQLHGEIKELTEVELVRQLREHAEADEHLFLFQVLDEDGRVVFRSASLGEVVLPGLAPTEPHRTVELPGKGRLFLSEFSEGKLSFMIGSRLEPMQQTLRQYTQASLALVAVVAAGSLGLGYAISRLALRPIRDIERTARRIGADNLAERIPVPPGRDEVAELVQLLNAMFDRIEASFRQIRQFSANASHELKTPLTLIRLNAERLRQKLAADPAITNDVDSLLEEIAHMQRVIESLLFLAKAESGALALTRHEHPTQPFIAAVGEDAAVLAEDRGLHFEIGASDAGVAGFDRDLLRQLLLNLVSNAVAATPAGGRIGLSSQLSAGRWRIELRDEGPGLPPEQLENIFERFVQVRRVDGPPATGHGLGLAICRSIARLHGGEVTATNRLDRSGLCLTVDLPA